MRQIKVIPKNYPYFIFFFAITVVTTVSCLNISWGQEQNFQAVREQSFNVVYTIELDTKGVPCISSATEIPSNNIRFDSIPEKQIVETTPYKTKSTIHPIIQEWVEHKASDSVIEVIITLREDQRIQRLPRHVPGQLWESPANQAILRTRNILIEELRQHRNKSQAGLVQRLEPHGLVVLEQYWLVNSLFVRLPIGSVKIAAQQPEVIYLQPRFGGEPPPKHDGNPNNDVAVARTQIQTDQYFNNTNPVSTIAVLDTGVRKSHVMFKRPRHLRAVRDCVRGGLQCEKKPGRRYNPRDNCNHGTSTIGIITANARLGEDFRGVSADVVDSFKVYKRCRLDSSAAIRGFQAALTQGNDVIVANMQAQEDESGAIATAADNAYDTGAIIIASNGNCAVTDTCEIIDGPPSENTVRSPAIAHKVIGVGAYDVETGNTPDYQGRGPATDGRVKPDVQAPTNTETASNKTKRALHIFTGTSGATPYVGAAAALVHDWLLGPEFGGDPFDNGQVYAWLINSGQTPSPFNHTEGAGHLKLFLGGSASIGKVSVSDGETINIPFPTEPGELRIDAAIWWPESTLQQHNNIDIRIFDPSNTEVASSTSIQSIFERARVDGSPLDEGTWELRIQGVSVPADPQTVYFVVHHTPFIP